MTNRGPVVLVPDGVPVSRAVLAATVETAGNALWEAVIIDADDYGGATVADIGHESRSPRIDNSRPGSWPARG